MTSNDKPTYILLKDVSSPIYNIPKGTEFLKQCSAINHTDGAYTYGNHLYPLHPNTVENNPEWFKKKEQVIEQPIVLTLVPNGNKQFLVTLSENLRGNDISKLVVAIDCALRPDTQHKEHWFSEKLTQYKEATDEYHRLELQRAEENAFNAARREYKNTQHPVRGIPVFSDFKDYKKNNNSNAQTQTTNVKEPPVRDYEVTEIICYDNEARFLENGSYRIFHDGVGFDFDYLMAKPYSKIKTVLRKSDNTVFTIGDEVTLVGIITGFEIENKLLKVLAKAKGDWQYLNSINHTKK